MSKVTFKRAQRLKGLALVAYRDRWDMKLNKKKFGTITQPEYGKFCIRVMIVKKDIMEDGNPNCPWRWIQLSYVSDTVEEAKKYIQNCFERLSTRHTIRFED